jgi:hypothetical protein
MPVRADRTATRAERLAQPLATDVVEELAISHGVCIRPVAQRRTDMRTGTTEVVPIPCGSTREARCPSCATKARALRATQCREGWHLTAEPVQRRTDPTGELLEIAGYRAELEAARVQAGPSLADQLDAAIAEADAWLADTGARGTAATRSEDGTGDGTAPARRTRSTRRRQDSPDLPRLPVDGRTLGTVYAGRDGREWRPSMFLTLTMPSYGRVRSDGTPVDPARYDYRRAARDAIHFAALVDRFWQNLRRCVGWDVQYFAAVEPQRRLAPHLHAAVRGVIPRAILRQVVAATYHQVWWPPCDEPVYPLHRLPRWESDASAYVDPDTGDPLPTWGDALDELDADSQAKPVHVLRFGAQVDAQGIIGGSGDAGRRVGYLIKYITKDVAACHTAGTDTQRAHLDRLTDALRYEPCSDRCANWLLYGVQPDHAKAGLVAGRCTGKAHRRDNLGHAGRRVLVSRKWSGKTLSDHRADRRAHVLTTLKTAGIGVPAIDPAHADRWDWSPVRRTDPDHPARGSLLLRAVAERFTWRQQYRAALAAIDGGGGIPATDPAAVAAA